MKLILDSVLDLELKEYLLSQDGINNVDIRINGFVSEINIDFDKKITPSVIGNYISLFQDNDYPNMISFDKENINNEKKLKYVVDDMCCEHCYESLVESLFKNNFVKSVESNFDFHKPAFDIEFIIEYDENYSEEELIKYIRKNI